MFVIVCGLGGVGLGQKSGIFLLTKLTLAVVEGGVLRGFGPVLSLFAADPSVTMATVSFVR